MVRFSCTIEQFGAQGEKTGWTYIRIPAAIARKIKPDNKKSFRVKGKLDEFVISGIALLPMGEGDFIMPLNAKTRKGIRKTKGAKLTVEVTEDKKPLKVCAELLECLEDEPKAMQFFKSLPNSHQLYFSKWIESAKTEETKAKRIANSVNAFIKGLGYSQMMRSLRESKLR